MQRTVLRIGRSASRACHSRYCASALRPRLFSSSARALYPLADGARKYIDNLYKATRNPVWHLLDTLQTHADADQHVYPYNALHDNRVSLEEFKKWEPVLSQPGIEGAIIELHELGYRVTEADDSSAKPIPSWIVLFLLQYRVKTPEQASDALMDLVFSHLSSASPDLQAPLLILTTYQLAKHNLLLPIRRVLHAFLALPLQKESEQQYNALLHALSSLTLRAVENTNAVHLILSQMSSHHLKLRPSTYDALLRPQFASFLLAKELFVRMVDEGTTPTYFQLEALLRIFAEQGQRELAERFWEAIQLLAGGEGEALPAGGVQDPRMRANTVMLNSFETRRKATKFLRRLVEEIGVTGQENPPAIPHAPCQPSSTSTSQPLSPRSSLLNHYPGPTPPNTTSASPPDYAKTAAFHVAAKDLSTPTQRLFEIFHSIPGSPSLVTYTILLRGLLIRREYKRAEVWWGRLERMTRKGKMRGGDAGGGGWEMDQEALSVGLQVLTRAGKPHEAFQLLERYAKRPPDDDESKARKALLTEVQDGANNNTGKPQPQVHNEPDDDDESHLQTVPLTTITLNTFLVALNRISRPDAVFPLFEHASTLYAVQPNSTTLCILLQVARLAIKMDDAPTSLSGAFARFKRLLPFRSLRRYNMGRQDHRRRRAVDEVISCVGHPSRGELRRYVDGVFRGMEPDEYARGVFLRVLFGVEKVSPLPSGLKLAEIESPAAAQRQSYDSDDSDTHPLSLPSLSPTPTKYTFTPPPPSTFPLLVPRTQKPFYPSIIPTNAAFFNYIALLGVSSRAPEIPLTLAWMREMGIQPSESTLALAMVLWFEVSVQAPLVERWGGGGRGGGEGGGEFGRLREWVRGWVGEGRVPGGEVMGRWRVVVNRMREGRR